MLLTGVSLIGFVKRQINSFKSRISADSGTFEAESCLTASVQNLQNKPQPITAQILAFKTRVAQLPHRIYCMGDSITNFGYYELKLNSLIGYRWIVQNYGISGNTTTQMLARFNQQIISSGLVDYVIIMGGVNDLAGSINATAIEANLQAMYDMAHNAGIKVIAMTVTPWKNSSSWNSTKQTQTLALNSWIMAMPTNVDYVINTYDLLNNLAGDNGALLAAYDSGDHIHPNQTGLELIGTTINSSITFTTTRADGNYEAISCLQNFLNI